MENNRIAVVGIIVEKTENVSMVNEILHDYSDFIIGRMGIPYREENINIISIVLNAPNDKINSLTGKLGMLEGVSAKALYANKK
ncbi:iron-only hydrogenase system regulator [Brachyspira hyodysenteriae]|uniref:TM1266 family iron-only hydrogenase system putative regulator n=1 Tax=Brachyspira hyodysenteriae TaxID=159 RepID=UPI0022CD4EEB|nr:TM1266 family iron-only hydrogenase system putative regulator [Brachyspira hyodysenteriae]MCZ9840369.1 iron-only hydrogenase system regulator [Brachyspira hyodysenteriae]MCZ9848756.1 iron-only hydrogenase system regulator [Brachyspira hyodysenteriae]MCZ9850502.1 iron-only hydrogenase system regulator [Brachyspira hyodysenteriae]MCZ9860746.1 iron-only hydrogenase system regulator [Brachyspira hyodysenteriae]MCZ9869754.1 iron-only hydrogenase system regulator [Brachyspira hyodysenteriae]